MRVEPHLRTRLGRQNHSGIAYRMMFAAPNEMEFAFTLNPTDSRLSVPDVAIASCAFHTGTATVIP